MGARHLRVLAVGLAVVAGACSGGGSGPERVTAEEARARFDDLIEALEVLPGVAATMGRSVHPEQVPSAMHERLTRIGPLAEAVADLVASEVLDEAVAEEILDGRVRVERFGLQLALRAGGTAEGDDRVAVGPVVIVADTRESIRSAVRGGLDNADPSARASVFLSRFQNYCLHFADVVLLLDPASRGALAPRLSPDDLPAELPINPETQKVDGHLFEIPTVEEWRRLLFDGQGRLIVPDADFRPGEFDAWAKYVNPAFDEAAGALAGVMQRSAHPY